MKRTSYKQHIQNKILNIQNTEFWPCDAAGKKCRWKMANTVDTNLFFLGTCDQKAFVCDITYGWKTSAADLFINVGKAADRSYRIPYPPFPTPQGKTGLFQASVFLSYSFYPTGNTALWTFRILAVRMFLDYMKWTDASLLPTRDDFRQNVWHRWERNLSIIFMKDGWPHIKQSHQSIAISSDRKELGT